MNLRPLLAAGAAAPLLSGCFIHTVQDWDRPDVDVPAAYANADHAREDVREVDEWWKEFDDPALNEVMALAEVGNLDLRQAWARIQQALYQARIVGADQFPSLDMTGGASRTWIRNEDAAEGFSSAVIEPGGQAFGVEDVVEQTDDVVLVNFGLTYEVDLWGRIASQARAATLSYEATRQDYEATALTLSGLVFQAWVNAQEQLALLNLLKQQLEISEQLLLLTELRFGQGLGTAVDVLQQRQQVASTRADIPPAESLYETAMNQLAVLVGKPPGTLEKLMPKPVLYDLPPFPEIGAPANLFTKRPDLRAAMLRLTAADYEVGAAVADMLPRVTIDLSYEFRAVDPIQLFSQQIGNIAGNIFQPLFDAGRRLNEIRQRKAIVDENLAAFGQAYLTALQEVEDALVQEKHQIEFLRRLRVEESFAEATLRESRTRYANGLSPYTDTLIAVQTLQAVQRRILGEQANLLQIRGNLYRALGGTWTQRLGEPGPTQANAEQLALAGDADSTEGTK